MLLKKIILTCCGIAFLIILAFVYAAFDVTRYAHLPAAAHAPLITVLVPPGQGLAATIRQLAQAEIIENPLYFKIFSRFNGRDEKIKAGEYYLSAAMTPAQVLDTLISGKVVLHRLTIPEGVTFRQIAATVARAGFDTQAAFVDAAQDAGRVGQLAPAAKSLEGYLFPDTYFFPRGTTAEEIVDAMTRRFQSVFLPEWHERAAQLNLSVHQVVTLASIIEKETGVPGERSIISSVFHNRLHKKMRLESDPTVIYGIANFDGNITRKHLKALTPYNTYRIRGLPPGPIANPGRAALYAALYPEQTPYLYFVSKKNKTHHFSTNFKDHNRAVRKYQLGK